MEQFLKELHKDYKTIYSDPELIFKNHPSLLNLTVMSSIMDLSVPKRMLACVLAALKANGISSLQFLLIISLILTFF